MRRTAEHGIDSPVDDFCGIADLYQCGHCGPSGAGRRSSDTRGPHRTGTPCGGASPRIRSCPPGQVRAVTTKRRTPPGSSLSGFERDVGERGGRRGRGSDSIQPGTDALLLVGSDVLPHDRVPQDGEMPVGRFQRVDEVRSAGGLQRRRIGPRHQDGAAQPSHPFGSDRATRRTRAGWRPHPSRGRSERRRRRAARRPGSATRFRWAGRPRPGRAPRGTADPRPSRSGSDSGTDPNAGSSPRRRRSRAAAPASGRARPRSTVPRTTRPHVPPHWSAAGCEVPRPPPAAARPAVP